MSREGFQAPALNPGSGSQPTTTTTTTTNNNTTSYTFTSTSESAEMGKSVAYLCGDCDTKVFLRKGDPIRCKECGYRVLYKQRTERLIQFEAR